LASVCGVVLASGENLNIDTLTIELLDGNRHVMFVNEQSPVRRGHGVGRHLRVCKGRFERRKQPEKFLQTQFGCT
jgi:hypothetical protein